MTPLMDEKDFDSYGVSTIHDCEDRAPVLAIARPQGDATRNETLSRTTHSAIHFRDSLPSIKYTTAGSRLILTCLDTLYIPTVFDCGSVIRNVGVHDDSSNIVIHVHCETDLLYSMILTPEQLADPTLKKEDGWISEYYAPSFQIRSPLYMYSLSATSIVFSLQDGGLLRLSNNGSGYNEHIFSDSSYFSSFKSILPWSGRPSNLVVSMRASVAKNLLFTISVDGRMKTWDIRKGQLLSMHDIFPAERPLTFLLEPVAANNLAIIEQPSTMFIVTYCAQPPGLFKVFKGRPNGIEEICQLPEEQPSTGLWRVFDIRLGEPRENNTLMIYVLWKLDTLSLVQVGCIDLNTRRVRWSFSRQDIETDIPSLSASTIEDYIFMPGRFSTRVINQALQSFTTSQDLSDDESSHVHLRQFTSNLIHGTVNLEIDPDTGNNLTAKYEEDIRLRYLNMAQICLELDRAAGEPHSLNYSIFSKCIYIAQTSKISQVRPLTQLEKLHASSLIAENTQDPLVAMLQQSTRIGQGLSFNSWYSIAQIFRDESLTERTLSADDAMFVAYERTIENQLSRSTVAMLQQHTPKPDAVILGLQGLLPLFALSAHGEICPEIGVDMYVATYRKIVEVFSTLITRTIAYLVYAACSAEDVDIYQASTLYIQYLQVYRRLTILSDALTKRLHSMGESEQSDTDTIKSTTDSSTTTQTPTNSVPFRALALEYNGTIPTRDILERTIISLLNSAQPALAVHFSKFILYSPFASYLKARSLLSNRQIEEAATLFARVAHPLLHSQPTKSEGQLKIKLARKDKADYYLHVAALFAEASHHVESLRFCNEALVSSHNAASETQDAIRQRTFNAAIAAAAWSEAYQVMSSPTRSIQKDNIRTFVTALCESFNSDLLVRLPFVGMLEEVDTILETKARNMLDVRSSPSYHKILYALRISQAEYRDAASIIYHKLQFLSNRTHINGFNIADHLEITESYLAVINAMRCMKEDDAWIIVGTVEYSPTAKKSRAFRQDSHDDEDEEDYAMGGTSQQQQQQQQESNDDGRTVRRKVLTLRDVKKEYETVLHGLQVQLNELAGLVNGSS